jgi:multidrug transporter EmrE-like cation transporter
MRRNLAFLFILLSLLFQVLSQILSKSAALRIAAGAGRFHWYEGYLPWYLASLACLGLQAICWPLALRRFPLFWAYMFMSGVYVALPLASHFIFNEPLSAWNLAGAGVIIVGIMVMLSGEARGADHV